MNNKICGIYKIVNKVNNKVYIGKAIDILKRWKHGHIIPLNKNSHKNNHLQSSWNKYGEDNFDFSIIEQCNENELNKKEKYWIRFYNSNNSQYGYNKTEGGDGLIANDEIREKLRISKLGEKNPMYGKKLSDEQKLKISLSNKNRIPWNKNKKGISEETRIKMSNSHKGKSMSGEAKLKIKNNHSHYWKGKESPFKGKKHSKESLEKMSKSLKGKKAHNKIILPDEYIIDMINRRKNKESYESIGKVYKINKHTVKRLIIDYERRQGNPRAIDTVPRCDVEEVNSNKEKSWDNF